MASDFHRPNNLILSPTIFSFKSAVAPVARSALAVISAGEREVEGRATSAWRRRFVMSEVGSGRRVGPKQQRNVSAVALSERR